MKLPQYNYASVSRKKLQEYLLSETHEVGKFKAKFFQKLGFTITDITLLEQALLDIAKSEEVTEVIKSPYGKKYVIDGTINFVMIQTVWIIEKEQKYPRFITAYPV
jgi:hypothetical protein